MNKKMLAVVPALLATAALYGAPATAGHNETQLAEGRSNSWYGPSRPYRDENAGRWAIGTFHGQNGANGNEETLTIHPDGTAELRTRGKAPEYGTFAGETLTLGARISKVEPARNGLVIDGAYYRR